METKHRVNEEIRGVKEVRLVTESGDSNIVSFLEAVRMAEMEELDLVEVAPQAVPPVCRVLDYQKFRYAEEKRGHETAKKQRLANKMQEVKEIRFRPVTDENDYQVKLRNILRFLEEGYRAKATVRFRGRELSHQEFGAAMMVRLVADAALVGAPEYPPRSEGRNMSVIFVPKIKKAK